MRSDGLPPRAARKMTPIQNVLFPVDFSPSCQAMAPFVRRVASLFSAQVTLLYVVQPSASGFELAVRSLHEVEADLKEIARTKLQSFLASEFPAKESPRLLLVGEAAIRIAQLVRERVFDLIVMPTHAGMFRRMLLGSTTAKVLNDVDCLVFTTQHAESISPRPLEHKEYVCAIGLQKDSERVLGLANHVAEAVHANLTVIHVVPSSPTDCAIQFDFDDRAQSRERSSALRQIEELQRAIGSHARVRTVIGPLKDSLILAARQLCADVLIIGRSPQSGSQGRMRDLTYAVVRDAPCPVLSV
jgi:nucleotide-binding universal stress UspA family protein